jgi:PAS domain S-box-containing protein
MPSAPPPADEPQRLAALHALGILDTPDEEHFRRLTDLVVRLFDVPIAAISLVDAEREWFKACYGTDARQADRRVAFCAHAILSDELLVVEDATADPRFADNPQVTEGGIRFYAGAPLHGPDGHRIGALCVKDTRPRTLSPEQRAILQDLAQIVSTDLRTRRITEDLARNRDRIAAMGSILEDSLNEIYVFDAETLRFVEVNRGARENIGYSMDELRRMHPHDIKPGLTAAEFDELVAPLRSGATDKLEFVTTHQRKDGSRYPVEVHVQLMTLAARPVFVAIILDITSRVKAEKALRQSEQRLELALAAAEEGLWDWDLRTNEVHFNDYWYRMLGYEPGELPMELSTWERLCDPDDLQLAFDGVQRHLRGETDRYRCEQRLRMKSGAWKWILDIGEVVERDESGAPTRMIGVHFDIDAQKRAQATLEQAQRQAEAASRSKSEFLANMSHEIRTPMNGIIGMTDLVLDTDLDDGQRQCLQLARSSADALLGVLNDILDFSKIEAGKLELSPYDFSLRDLLADTLRMLAVRAGDKRIEVLADVAADVPDRYHADGNRLRQIVVNLVGNAIKFTSEGHVLLRVHTESANPDSHLLHLIVEDTGIGIPEELQGRIFEAFSQADGSTTRQFGGTGLGLAISSSLVKMMGGHVWVESQLGRGSRFHFTVEFTPAAGAGETTLPDAELRDARVLSVDDNEVNRRILDGLLSGWGMTVESAADATEALRLATEAVADGRPFDLVLLDCHLPGMDGFELAEVLGRLDGFDGLPMVMLTSGAAPGDSQRCREVGLAAHVMKPIKQSELMTTIGAALARRHERPAPADDAERTDAGVDPAPGLDLLLVEDNAVNQRLAERLLERWGHRVTLAVNGAEALDRIAEHRFDAVLMDIQMPVMDGFEAVARIRASERGTGAHLPVIAMTAHAMKGDRERCLEAGMDDYIAKPIEAGALRGALEALSRDREDPARAEPAPAAPPADPVVFDPAELLERVGGSQELMLEIVELFLGQCDELLGEVLSAAERRDPRSLHHASHSLKSSVGNLAAHRAFEAALRLERMGDTGDLGAADDACRDLRDHVDQLRGALADLTRRSAA